ncbi:BTAD domain-containing putative transcriptional regulator [Georgenia sp. M64]|uniref:AfsR/SARP family transcriptional regulator n=1 Tax=Georgenia sp. M64 TaxID=3120520 RepID=UPI0030E1FE97
MNTTATATATAPAPAPAARLRLSVRVLGNLSVRRGTTTLDAAGLGGPKPRQILEILVLNLGSPVSKDQLVDTIWAGRPPAEGTATLESYVSVLRRHLQPGAGRTGPLRTTTGGYVLDRDAVDLDLDDFDAALRAGEAAADPDTAYAHVVEALRLGSATLLADEVRPSWVQAARDLHAARVHGARVRAAELAVGTGRFAAAVGWARSAVEDDVLDERAWCLLIRALELDGRPAEGLRAYERCRRVLERELGCAPGPQLQATFVRLLQTTADGADDFSQALAALLAIQEQLSRASDVAPDAARPVAPAVRETLRAAGTVVDSFLRRALAFT